MSEVTHTELTVVVSGFYKTVTLVRGKNKQINTTIYTSIAAWPTACENNCWNFFFFFKKRIFPLPLMILGQWTFRCRSLPWIAQLARAHQYFSLTNVLAFSSSSISRKLHNLSALWRLHYEFGFWASDLLSQTDWESHYMIADSHMIQTVGRLSLPWICILR